MWLPRPPPWVPWDRLVPYKFFKAALTWQLAAFGKFVKKMFSDEKVRTLPVTLLVSGCMVWWLLKVDLNFNGLQLIIWTVIGYSLSSVSQPVPCVCFSARADESSERAGDSSESAGDNGKDYLGFLREHVRLYPKFVREWGVSGCKRSLRHQNSSLETECGGAATDEMPSQRWLDLTSGSLPVAVPLQYAVGYS